MSGHTCPECGDSFPSSSNATGGSIGHKCNPVRSANRRILVGLMEAHSPTAPSSATLEDVADALLNAGVQLPDYCLDRDHYWPVGTDTCRCGLVTLPGSAALPRKATFNRNYERRYLSETCTGLTHRFDINPHSATCDCGRFYQTADGTPFSMGDRLCETAGDSPTERHYPSARSGCMCGKVKDFPDGAAYVEGIPGGRFQGIATGFQ